MHLPTPLQCRAPAARICPTKFDFKKNKQYPLCSEVFYTKKDVIITHPNNIKNFISY